MCQNQRDRECKTEKREWRVYDRTIYLKGEKVRVNETFRERVRMNQRTRDRDGQRVCQNTTKKRGGCKVEQD